MIFILRPQITRLAPLNLVLGALAIAAVALWRFGALALIFLRFA